MASSFDDFHMSDEESDSIAIVDQDLSEPHSTPRHELETPYSPEANSETATQLPIKGKYKADFLHLKWIAKGITESAY